jgi:hypothetical protein
VFTHSGQHVSCIIARQRLSQQFPTGKKKRPQWRRIMKILAENLCQAAEFPSAQHKGNIIPARGSYLSAVVWLQHILLHGVVTQTFAETTLLLVLLIYSHFSALAKLCSNREYRK